MEKIKEKLASLRQEADANVERAEKAEATIKLQEQRILEQDAEIKSLTHQLGVIDRNLEVAETQIKESKSAQLEGENSKTANEGLTRKVQLLEEELDAAEKNVKETMEKLRQVDVKAEHFERQVQRVEQERDVWEKKYEDAQAKYRESKAELDELVQNMEGL